MERKVLGILGGMGAGASELFYGKIIRATSAAKDQDHLDLLLWSHASIPDRTAMITAGRTEELWEVFAGDVAMMKQAGCDWLAVPCNTSHYFADRFSEAMDGRFISMIDCAAAWAAAHCGKRIGVLATDGTVQSDLYGTALRKYGAECVYPSMEGQKTVMSVIYDEIKQGARGSLGRFEAVLDEMREKDCQAVILACTELSVLRDNYPALQIPFCLDAMDVLTKRCIEACGGTYCGSLRGS